MQHLRTQLYSFAIRLLAVFALLLPLAAKASDVRLPELGGAGGGILSPEQEYQLGQQWLRMFRASVATSKDPFIQSYVENLVTQIANYSDLTDKRLEVVIAENPTLNAFAVPGGIVGVHTGLFTYAQTEEQFGSVIAHELAHLSQKHFLRSIERQQNASIPTLAALIVGIILAASGGGDAGMAVISATQAGAIDSQLRFSRKMEQEADRVGMNTMVRANMDPYAMPGMFEQMLKSQSFRSTQYEFLLTHPLTESRVSDAKLRAQQYPKRYVPPQLDFEIAKIRAHRHEVSDSGKRVKYYRNHLQGNQFSESTSRYGLVLALIDNERFTDAQAEIDLLLKAEPNVLAFQVVQSDLHAAQGDYDSALARLKEKLQTLPNNHMLNVRYAELLMKAGAYQECEAVLKKHVKRRPKDEYVWYLLAEAHGLAGHIFDVHQARAEYFLLNGLYEKAEIQLVNALALVGEDKQFRAQVEQRLRETREKIAAK